MKYLKTFTVLAMLALWLPVTNHCRLEQLPGFAFLVCCDHEDAAPHQDNDCETDSCALVESGFYKTEECQATVAAPALVLAIFPVPPLAEQTTPQAASHVLIEAIPPELPKVWQFSFRTALPPRAPSVAS